MTLLALLVTARNRSASRERLMALLWPDSDVEPARHLLREAVYRLRERLGEDALRTVGDELLLDSCQVRCDVWEFEAAVSAGKWEAAEQLYAGALLEGFLAGNSPELEQWLDLERSRLAALRVKALESLARQLGDAGDRPAAVAIWRRCAAADPCNERVALQLMTALDRAGDRAAALKHAALHAALLQSELGAAPDPAVSAFAERLRRVPELHECAAPPQTASVALESIEPHSPPAVQRVSSRLTWPRLAYAGLTAFGTLVLLSAASRIMTHPSVLLRDRIAIAPFRTSGADSSMSFLRDGLVELLSLQLTGEIGPAAVDPGESLRAWRSAKTDDGPGSQRDALRVARALRAAQVVYGALVGTAHRFTVIVSILDVSSGEARLPPIQVSGSLDSLPALVATLSARMLGPNAGPWRLSAGDAASANPEALRAYLAGMVEYRRGHWFDAGKQLFHAVELDSSFAAAAYRFALVHAIVAPTTPFGTRPSRDPRLTRLYGGLWNQRQRLSAVQRLLLEAVADSLYVLWHQQALPQLERAVALLPSSVEAWELLGTAYYHAGALLGREDWAARAGRALRKAIALDSSIAVSARSHLADLAFLTGDARAHARFATRSTGPRGPAYLSYQSAILRGAAAPLRSARREYANAWARGEAEGPDWALRGLSVPQRELDSLLALLELNASNAQQRREVVGWAAAAAAMGGRPGRADSLLRDGVAADTLELYSASLDYAWDDSVAAARAPALSRDPTLPLTGAISERPLACNSALSRLRRADTNGVATILATEPPLDQQRSVAGALSAVRRGPLAMAAICGQVLRGVLASLAPSGLPQLLRADSIMRVMPLNYADFWNYDLALAFARRGEYALAAAAVRRHLTDVVPLPRLVLALRQEGRWAALAGDPTAAIKAYRHYLLWREAPEPALVAQRDSVRTELAALEQAYRKRTSPWSTIRGWFSSR